MQKTRLSRHLEFVILEGVKAFGSYDPKDVLLQFGESLTLREYSIASGFLQWVHDNKRTFGWGNIQDVHAEYQDVEI